MSQKELLMPLKREENSDKNIKSRRNQSWSIRKEGVCDWCRRGESRQVSRALKRQKGFVSMKIAAASTAIMNQTQNEGEGWNVTLCGTRWWVLPSQLLELWSRMILPHSKYILGSNPPFLPPFNGSKLYYTTARSLERWSVSLHLGPRGEMEIPSSGSLLPSHLHKADFLLNPNLQWNIDQWMLVMVDPVIFKYFLF